MFFLAWKPTFLFYFWSDYSKFIANNIGLTVSIRTTELLIEALAILILTGQTRPHKLLGRVKFTDYIQPSSVVLIALIEQIFKFMCDIVVIVIDFKNFLEQRGRLQRFDLKLYFHSYFLHKAYSFVLQALLLLTFPFVIWRLFQYQRYLTRKEFEQNQSFGSSSTSFIYSALLNVEIGKDKNDLQIIW